ncbi:CHAP domain-containing protein [Actinoallomurus sp. NPDC050550]|uniref:CHAP domain-containing protein n=1 Tax=Actinoallomurus sp. NPDC050550 TaxID=3154937 RepID=UPI0033F40A36
MSARHPPPSGLKHAALKAAIAGITIVGAAVATELSVSAAPHFRVPVSTVADHDPVPDLDTVLRRMIVLKGHPETASAADVLKVALSQVGTTADAAGGTKFNQWFMSTSAAQTGAQRYGGKISDYADASWCDMFVSWVGARAGAPGIGVDAFTHTHAQWFQQRGRWGAVPRPGAVVFFSFSGDKTVGGIEHVGLVVKDDHDGTIETIEGNTDKAVKIRIRPVSEVVGYGYPDYLR